MRSRALSGAALIGALLSLPARADKLRIITVLPGLRYKSTACWWVSGLTNKTFRAAIYTRPRRLSARVSDIPWLRALTLEGYAAKEIQLTEGPMSWVATLKGHNHGAYWLLKTDHHLALAEAATVRQGESVLAIGNPDDAMLFSDTKGIVSAVGRFDAAGPGTWIQTDAPINPGNSGGPLLNSSGEVIGINSQKLIKKNVTGIGFALSASDLLEVLHRFYPAGSNPNESIAASANVKLASGASMMNTGASMQIVPGFGITEITSEPNGAEIFLDDKFVGSSPATLRIAEGTHTLTLKSTYHTDWNRSISILKDSTVTVKATLAPM